MVSVEEQFKLPTRLKSYRTHSINGVGLTRHCVKAAINKRGCRDCRACRNGARSRPPSRNDQLFVARRAVARRTGQVRRGSHNTSGIGGATVIRLMPMGRAQAQSTRGSTTGRNRSPNTDSARQAMPRWPSFHPALLNAAHYRYLAETSRQNQKHLDHFRRHVTTRGFATQCSPAAHGARLLRPVNNAVLHCWHSRSP